MEIPKEFLPVLLVQIALFLGLWMALKRFWFDPALRVIAAREQRSRGALAEADRLQGEADRLRREHAAAIDQARGEAQREVQDMLRQAEAAHRQLVEQATADAERTTAEMRERVAAEVTAARRELEGEVHAIASELARTVLGRAV